MAAVLAIVTHRSHSKVGTANVAPRGQKTGTSTRVGPAEYYERSSDDGRPTGGEQPAALLEPLPQGQVQRHAGIGYELVQALDAPVLQMVEQLPDVHHFFATCLPVVAEQVIDVPKIILENIPSRRLCREPQLAEQLAEVPTILYFLKQRIPMQIVDTPVPHGSRGASGGLQGFLPSHVEQTVDIPALRSGVRRLQGFLPEQSATAFGEADHRFPAASVEQIVDFPVSGRGLQDSRPGQRSASSSQSPADFANDAFHGVFALFSKTKKVRLYLRTRGRTCLRTRAHGRRQLMTRPRCLRRRRRRSLTLTSSTWSSMGAGGGASGSQLASSIAGGWPLRMGHRLAIQYGGLRGSSAEGQGDWGLVRQWIHGLRQCLGACAVLYFLREGELGS